MRLNISVCCSKSFIIYKKLFKIWQFFYPVTEGMPLHKLVSLSRMINIDECLIVHRAGAHLVVAGREKLDHVVPVLLIFSLVHVFQTDLLKAVYNGLHVSESVRSHMVMAEIIDVERFGVDLVHGACGVCHSCHFVGVIFLPPVERSRNIHGYKDLADKLSVVASSHAETLRKIEIVRSKDKISVLIIAAVLYCIV